MYVFIPADVVTDAVCSVESRCEEGSGEEEEEDQDTALEVSSNTSMQRAWC